MSLMANEKSGIWGFNRSADWKLLGAVFGEWWKFPESCFSQVLGLLWALGCAGADLLGSPCSGWRRDLLRPRRHHHQHRNDRRWLVERGVQGPLRPLPCQLRGAQAVGTPAADHALIPQPTHHFTHYRQTMRLSRRMEGVYAYGFYI